MKRRRFLKAVTGAAAAATIPLIGLAKDSGPEVTYEVSQRFDDFSYAVRVFVDGVQADEFQVTELEVVENQARPLVLIRQRMEYRRRLFNLW